MTLTNQVFCFFFHKKRAGHCQRKRWKKTTGAAKKPCTQSIMQKYLQQRETVGEAAADEVEEEVMISVWCVGRRKRMMWTLKTGWHVKCVHSGYILSAYPPIIHTLYHMQTFIAIFVYSSNFHLILTVTLRGGRGGSRLSVNCRKYDL